MTQIQLIFIINIHLIWVINDVWENNISNEINIKIVAYGVEVVTNYQF